jgi:hypothetical protein
MVQAIHNQLDAARDQLDDAIELYFSGRLYSAATLAGASDNVLGQMLQALDQKHALRHEVSATLALSYGGSYDDAAARAPIVALANYERDWLKHYKADEQNCEFDAEDAAASLINRAMTDCFKLTERETPQMERFKNHRIDMKPHLRR